VSKLSRLPEGIAYFVIHGMVSNGGGQSVLSDFFVVPMRIDGGLQGKPLSFEEFAKVQQLKNELLTETVTEDELAKLKSLLPDVIDFGRQLHMDQKQQALQWEMEKKMAVYEEKLRHWKASKEQQLKLEFSDKPDFGFVKRRRENKEREIKTILDESSKYFRDLTSLNGESYLKVLAVFYH